MTVENRRTYKDRKQDRANDKPIAAREVPPWWVTHSGLSVQEYERRMSEAGAKQRAETRREG
jgi:hypothetical protein